MIHELYTLCSVSTYFLLECKIAPKNTTSKTTTQVICLFFPPAVCEKCGAMGVKHAFYTRERRFCSLACARGSQHDNDNVNNNSNPIPYEGTNPAIPALPSSIQNNVTPVMTNTNIPLPVQLPALQTFPHVTSVVSWYELTPVYAVGNYSEAMSKKKEAPFCV